MLSFGENPTKHILIDCGYPETFHEFLKPHLNSISVRGESLEKLIITHIDSDHIWGGLSFLKKNDPKFIEIKEVWHNAFRHINCCQEIEKEDELDATDLRIIQKIAVRGYSLEEERSFETEISAIQGTTLGALILNGNYSWNQDFGNQAVAIENGQYIQIDENSSIFLLSPNKDKLKELRDFWESELYKLELMPKGRSSSYDDAFEMLMTWDTDDSLNDEIPISSENQGIEDLANSSTVEDSTPTNGSSIAFVFENCSKKILFLGDSHPSLIVHSLNRYQPDGKVFFDVVKISHHGSKKNISDELLSKIASPKFVFSSNGKKGHPDKETVAKIILENPQFHKQLFFNYKTKSSEYFEDMDQMKKFNYSITYLETTEYCIKI